VGNKSAKKRIIPAEPPATTELSGIGAPEDCSGAMGSPLFDSTSISGWARRKVAGKTNLGYRKNIAHEIRFMK
jgi:hypothetical protein